MKREEAEVSLFAPKAGDQDAPAQGRGDAVKVDVLVLTAVQDELEALLALGEQGRGGWTERRDSRGFRYYQRSLSRERGGMFEVGAAWIGEMGVQSAAIRGAELLRELDPDCLAMCGICAGYRKKVSLGDVIVADQLWRYDEGKEEREPGEEAVFSHATRTFDLEAAWKMDASFLAKEIDLAELSRERPPSRDSQRRWLLHAIDAHTSGNGPAPAEHEARRRACPGYTERLKEALKEGLVARQGRALALTDAGRDWVDEDRTLHPDPVREEALRVHVGALATGSAVVEDPEIFERLRKIVRTTIGLEMEGTAIGELARRFEKRSILVKAVQDHADGDKDDAFRAFACRASAMFLLAFLEKHVEPERRAEPIERRRVIERWGEEERVDGFLARVERIAQLRYPKAGITRRRACAPFSGVLEVELVEDGIVDVRVIAALDRPITEELVLQYLDEIEPPYRERSPYLRSTLVHTGHKAPPSLLQIASRRRVGLQPFTEYQGLIDLTPYLEWQTNHLEISEVYPPSLYVDQPAHVELAGSRERAGTEDALRSLWELLDAPSHPRFALVLGDFGAGKTFLLHELCRRMVREKHSVWPVLVEMNKLEKQSTLRELLAAHFARAGMDGYRDKAFEYMLAEGRIALLFDGFDELALRLTYDRATEHFETVLQAAQGLAKVVVSSRRQHFLTDQQVKRALTERAERIPGYRLVMLEAFGEPQIRQFLRNLLADPEEAEERYRLLDEVKDLLGLSRVPRLLAIIAKIPPGKLRAARKATGEISSAKLYELLVNEWLDFEHARANPPGAPKGISRRALEKGIEALAVSLWHRPGKTAEVNEIRECLVQALTGLGEPALDPSLLAHLFGSGSLLVRDAEGVFSFMHRSVLEWIIAHVASRELDEKGDAAALEADEISELMADFLACLAGPQKASAWAWGKLQGVVEGVAKRNALLLLRRIEKGWGRVADVELQMPATIDLEGQDLRGKDHSGVDWRDANLARVDLRGAMLVGANLAGASLVGARLARADLRGANLSRTNLGGADLSFARLSGADLSESVGLPQARLAGAKLVGVRGLPGHLEESLLAAGAAPPLVRRAARMYAMASPCRSVAWSPDGELIATGHEDGTIRLFDPIAGWTLRVLEGHADEVLSVAWSPDGKVLASGSDDHTVRLWDVGTGRTLHVLQGHANRVWSVAWSPDGLALASGSDDCTVRLWDAETGRTLRVLKGYGSWVWSVAWSPDGRMLASGSDDNTVRLWDAETGSMLRVFEGHTSWVASVAWSPDGLMLASGSGDKTVHLWDVATGRTLRIFEGHVNRVRSVAWSPDGLMLLSGSDDTTVRLWDVATGRALRILEGHANWVRSVAWSPDGTALASVSTDSTVRLWDVGTGRALHVFEGHADWVQSVAWSSDGMALASGSSDNRVRLWNVRTGRTLRVLEGHTNWVQSVAWSPDGTALASASGDKTVRLWEAETGRTLRVLEGHANWVQGVAWSPDGAALASGSGDRTVRVWEVETGRALRVLEGHANSVQSVAWSPDGAALASGARDNTVRLWNVRTGRALRVLEGHAYWVQSVAWSPDGLALASGSGDKTIRLWGAEAGRTLRVLEGHAKGVTSVAWSLDGKALASGSDDCTVRLWDWRAGRVRRVLEGHASWVKSVAWSPDRQRLASASDDGTIRLWSASTGQPLAVLLPLPEGWVAFTPDGRYKLGGDIAGSFWHVVGLCRFEPGELDEYLPLRLDDDAPLLPAAP